MSWKLTESELYCTQLGIIDTDTDLINIQGLCPLNDSQVPRISFSSSYYMPLHLLFLWPKNNLLHKVIDRKSYISNSDRKSERY